MPDHHNIDYDQYRNDIKSGDLLAWSSDEGSVWSRALTTLVRFFTLSEYSHVGIAYWEDNHLYVLEATIPRIQLRHLSERKGFYHIPVRLEWKPGYELVLKRYIGKSYSILDCIRGYLGKTDVSDDRWQCAELCNDFYKRIGIDIGRVYTPSKVVRAMMAIRRSYIQYVK